MRVLRHQTTSIGVLAVFLRGAPNRPVSVRPSEQPLPKEKPQRAAQVVGVLAELAVRGRDHEAVLVVGDRHDLVHVLDLLAREADLGGDASRRCTPSMVLARM